jgi:hypothetical protein
LPLSGAPAGGGAAALTEAEAVVVVVVVASGAGGCCLARQAITRKRRVGRHARFTVAAYDAPPSESATSRSTRGSADARGVGVVSSGRMHAWQTLTIAVIAIGIAACMWTVLERRERVRYGDAGRAPPRPRLATLLAMTSAAAGLAVVHFGFAYFRYFAKSNAFEYGPAFTYSAEHAWPLLFLPWSAWVFRVAVAALRGDRAGRYSPWTGAGHAIASGSLLVLAAKGAYLAGYFQPHGSATEERDFVPLLQGMFVLLALLGVAAGIMLAVAKTNERGGGEPPVASRPS